MKLEYVRPWASILGSVNDDEIQNFVVLSGPNGSGKSHLLEAVERGSISVDGRAADNGGLRVRRFIANQLAVPTEGAQAISSYGERWLQLEGIVSNLKEQAAAQRPKVRDTPQDWEAEVEGMLVAQRQLTNLGISQILSEAGKPLIDFTRSDFRRYSPLIAGVRDPFAFSINELFLSYFSRRQKNLFLRWAFEKGETPDDQSFTNEEFVDHLGPPPWETLNETAQLIGLEYSFIPPEGFEDSASFQVKLLHKGTGAEVTTDLLSSGEKTLLLIAMSLYTGSELAEAIELPEVLLLDEADSTLHPSMIKSLIRVLDELLVQRYGVKVILTTHSPTTVALAPEDSLYTMRRAPAPRLQPAKNRDNALNSLTVWDFHAKRFSG